ncbi:hypothetical protein EZV62_024100 [Acer yangbiense]|uniref:GDSL esterase/lipase n=1 Tax=Acer yangbiense TaxID=1000413 RepID=A0A5C7H5S0_9ROSI|nr:hypothetical protein EZV62_024100 [Acer yangbiense]
MITMYGTNGSSCVDFINNAVQLFNAKLVSLVDDFNNNLRDAKFIYINSYQIALTPTPTTGLRITNVPCCNATNTISFQCISNRIPCPNRNNYAFWDAVHPTEAADVVTTRRAYTALLPQDTRPSDIRTLAASNL